MHVRSVLVVVAHPDDELMAAGTLARFVGEGAEVNIIAVFYSDLGRNGEPIDKVEERWSEFEASCLAIGATSHSIKTSDEDVYIWGQKAVRQVDEWITNTAPDLIITNKVVDTNQSHSKIGQVVRTACRKNTCSLWHLDNAIPGGFETTHQPPNILVNITDFVDRKQAAYNAYQSQLERYPGMFEIEMSRNRYYGGMLAAEDPTIKYAEAFTLGKQVWL